MIAGARYVHTNLVARDCARLTGVHLRLPGAVPDGPTLEIFSIG